VLGPVFAGTMQDLNQYCSDTCIEVFVKKSILVFVLSFSSLLFLAPWIEVGISSFFDVSPPFAYETEVSIAALQCRGIGVVVSVLVAGFFWSINAFLLRHLVLSTRYFVVQLISSVLLVFIFSLALIFVFAWLHPFLFMIIVGMAGSDNCAGHALYFLSFVHFWLLFYWVGSGTSIAFQKSFFFQAKN
jgi:hypothetical protein